MITVFQPLIDEHRTAQEKDLFQWSGNPPSLDGVYNLGDHRGWTVHAIETYRAGDAYIWLAHCFPQGENSLFEGRGTVHDLLQIATNLSFYLHLSPDEMVLGHGWRMAGDAPTGRLYGSVPTADPECFDTVDLPWYVDTIDTYKPVGSGNYSAIHVCHCVPVNSEQLILV